MSFVTGYGPCQNRRRQMMKTENSCELAAQGLFSFRCHYWQAWPEGLGQIRDNPGKNASYLYEYTVFYKKSSLATCGGKGMRACFLGMRCFLATC
ncbi:hypothetical protein [Thalassospira marina]|uniref:Uncharacterized protein n=1 Tax=Thalassospira marina TaxID=2048283 RepID=A0A2N3KGU8_9PROT|nr:hypothetical protein [Thalassospira marina]PKR49751.1 hypothetical protein COO20_22285 [Thalassospira marina]